jgi:adenine-specific DNA-methyltransferase
MKHSPQQIPFPMSGFTVAPRYSSSALVTVYHGDRLELLRQIPPNEARLVVTSPPYNIGKKYEKKTSLGDYLAGQQQTLAEAARILADDGSLCWQVGNHVDRTEVTPLDIPIFPICKELGLKLRNRIIWHFEHGLHCSRRFSGRYETILWFTKRDEYVFNLDAVRIPQKYPGKKYFKGPKTGQYSCNPLGKNPGDLWIIPNVKHNHIEKTAHPCQFPVELIERLVLALTNRGDLVVDPYGGVGTTACAAVMNKRRAAISDTVLDYLEIARQRIELAVLGKLQVRPKDRPVYKPDPRTAVARRPSDLGSATLLEM